MNKFGKRQQKKFHMECDEIMNKHCKLLVHHLGSVFQRYSREMFKLNEKYFEIKDLEKPTEPYEKAKEGLKKLKGYGRSY